MPRPLFEIAREISIDWTNPSPSAKTYLKGMYYLLGMDDHVADLDSATTIRMFLLYSKQWTGQNAERIKVELQNMRTTRRPTNADLLAAHQFAVTDVSISCCELCGTSFGAPPKHVQAYTHWNECARMCMHCAFFLSRGIDSGDGAVFMATGDEVWCHLHGQANAATPYNEAVRSEKPKTRKRLLVKPKLRYRFKRYGHKVIKKCSAILARWFRLSA
jgi:hypothetical protein